MNWLAFDARAYAAALFGCILAVLLATHVEPLRGATPWLAGLLAGSCCAAVTRDRSDPRGLVIAVMAVWAAALEAAGRSGRELVPALFELHATLGVTGYGTYLVGFALALLIGRTSWRRGAQERLAGV